ncbi:MAG: 50S ribosomal protein L11 [Candidatus Hodarchaeota archaeon]
MSYEVVEALVEGGKATAGPPLGPQLGPLGVNVVAIVEAINEHTKEFRGMRVPVKVIVNTDDKSFEIEVGIPPTASLILKEIGTEKGSGETPNTIIGNINFEHILKIAKTKLPGSLAKDLKAACLEILGSCVSLGVTVEEVDPREIQEKIKEGQFDDVIS